MARTVCYQAVVNAFIALRMVYGDKEISSSEFNDKCCQWGISLSNGMKNAYEKARIIVCPSRGRVVIQPYCTEKQVKIAFDIAKRERKERHQKDVERKSYNLELKFRRDTNFTPEACADYLKSKGWFVYKPQKGEKIFVGKEFNY